MVIKFHDEYAVEREIDINTIRPFHHAVRKSIDRTFVLFESFVVDN
jgi:hypothetical protein